MSRIISGLEAFPAQIMGYLFQVHGLRSKVPSIQMSVLLGKWVRDL